ncbi:major facilitator family protein [Vibrio ichthyoenteri ATCC 700023]|uniref:Major facilitator family protein n=1 Tax=Vibrio ichthyoenteri ATCC 700023 TaxID=870968 RepID=F9S0C4_9VIBR|nr:sugar efflux transporter [Vibrio ichthyoenteri]EGU43394.1 major facilitator family protein [Vibrio ichthyoenteri ATCC 700023]
MRSIGTLFSGQNGVLFAINSVTALAFAFILPVMSLFLITELNAPPAYLGIYTTLTAIITIIVSQKLTALIDQGVPSKRLFLFSLLGIIASAVGFSFAQTFWHALLIGCTAMPIASSAIPLLLTIIRNYADSSGQNSAKLNSQMRSSVSLLWIFGPPLAFISVEHLGFTTNYYLSIAFALAVILIVTFGLKLPQANRVVKTKEQHDALPKQVWFLAFITLLANIGNSTYINGMPLLITREMGLPTSYPGFLFGLTAAVEIPVMLLAVGWAERWNKPAVIRIGFVSAMAFYVGMFYAQTMPVLLALQILNGIFFGIFVGLGVTIMQDYAPNNIGKASAIYTNAMLIGTMIGTSSMGVISQYFGFRMILLSSLIAISFAFIALSIFMLRNPNHVNNELVTPC